VSPAVFIAFDFIKNMNITSGAVSVVKRLGLAWMAPLICLLLFVVQGLGQGTVAFNNRVPGTVLTHVWYGCPPNLRGNWTNDFPVGTNSYAEGYVLTGAPGGPGAATTFAQLLGAPGANVSEYSLVPSSTPPTTFRTGGAAGNIVVQTVTFSNIPADAPVATFQMVVWDNSSGLYPTWAEASVAWNQGVGVAGKSDPFVLTNIGGGTNPAPFLTNLTSFAWGVWECPPQILQHPTNQAAVVGGQAVLNVVVKTWGLTTIYQWYHNNAPSGGTTNQSFGSMTNVGSLVVTNVQPSNFGSYFVTVNNLSGLPGYSKTSAVANITLASSPSLTNFSVDSNAKFSFRTEVGPNYVVEYKSALTDSTWVQLSTNAGTGGIVDVTDPAVGSASRFYRVRLY
jgi:hypothetical protein